MKELEYPFNGESIIKRKKSIKKALLERENVNYIEKKIAVLGGSTTKVFVEILDLFLLNQGIKCSFYESEYNMYYQDGMFPNEELEIFAPDIVYIHTSNRNIEEYPDFSSSREDVEKKINLVTNKFIGLWEHIHDTYKCSIIQNNFELPFYRILGNKEASDYRGRISFVNRINAKFYDYIDTHENIFIHDIAFEQAEYGLSKWSDPFYWHMYKYCMCVPAIPYSAFSVANIIKSIYGKNKKVLNLDCDNTLWGGIIGDDGVDNIEIGQETSIGQVYSEFQEYIRRYKEIGVLLTVNSKNEAENAIAGFDRPDSVLKKSDFVSFKANWNPKSINLSDTAMELNLGTDSFVFVDDNPAEREIIRQSLGGVGIIDIQSDAPEKHLLNVDRAGYFEVTSLSDDDMKRNAMYKANAERTLAQNSFTNYGEYLDSLEMNGEIHEFIPTYMGRIAQLTNKSNQFNLTTKRYSQAEIEEAQKDEMRITLYGKLEDKFGDNGVVSVVIGTKKDGKDGPLTELHIDLWIMSCRVLKRDMEYAMMDELVEQCITCGIKKIVGYYYPTKKNGMVKDFYDYQGFTKISEDNDGNTVWEYDIDDNYQKKNMHIRVNMNKE